jgi:VWFA-related protein
MNALVLVLLAGGAWAAPPSADPVLTFSTSVDLVRVTVTVTDKKGSPVSDLRENDIEIREDGRPQRIRFLAHTRDSSTDGALDLSVALLLDVSRSMATLSKLSRHAALGFLDAVPRAKELQWCSLPGRS